MNFMNSGNDVLYYILCVVSAVIVLPMLLYWMWNKLRQQMIKDSIKCWACFGILGVLLIEIFFSLLSLFVVLLKYQKKR